LQLNYAHTNLHADTQLVAVIGLSKVIVSSGRYSLNDFLDALSRSEQNNVRRNIKTLFTQAPAHLGSFHTRHHPIKHGKAGRVGFLQNF
jgi:hypothetical protein